MHTPDGVLEAQTSIAAAAVAAGAVGYSLRRARRELRETPLLILGLVGAVIFAGQLINFPVADGTSGHLIGGALAAILIGPGCAVLAMTLVVSVQAIVFADGGLEALGVNVLNLAVVAPLVAYGIFRLLRASLPAAGRWVMLSSFAAGLVSVVAAALAFSLEFALGGTAAVDAWTVAVAMVEVHLLIGAVEGVITALIVGAVFAVRPELVYGVREVPARRGATAVDLIPA